MDEPFKTDLRLVFPNPGNEASIDLAFGAKGLETVTGIDNLAQALTLRLLIDEGELTELGHPLYGSKLRDLLGVTLDRANLELMRRYVRQTLLSDSRVAEVTQVKVAVQATSSGIVEVFAVVKAINGASSEIGVSLHVI